MKSKLLLTFFVVFVSASLYAQQTKTITGQVLDQDQFPLIGATVLIEGTSEGTATDDAGNFSLKIKEGDTLEISYVFYVTKVLKTDSKNHYVIELVSDEEILDDIVVVAYGTSTKEAVTGAIAMINSEDIEKRPGASALSALEGAAAGVRVNNTSGQPGSEGSIRIRGFTSLASGGNSPLVVVDGVPYPGSINEINRADIESISVLKDASSTTLYGNKASNGVILVTTKKGSKGTSKFTVDIKQGIVNIGMKDYETMGADDFMNTYWTGYRNSLVTKGTALEDANLIANRDLISSVLKTNIYDVPDNELFIDGKLNPKASIRPGYLNDRDWIKPVERTGYYQDISLGGRVNNEKGGAYISGGFFNNEGYFLKASFKRFTGRVNADYKVTDWMKIGGNISGNYSERVNTATGSSVGNAFYFGRSIAPIYPVYLHDPKTGDFVYDEFGKKIYDTGVYLNNEFDTRNQFMNRNYIWENELNSNLTVKSLVNGSFFTDINIVDNLVLTLRGDLNLTSNQTRDYSNALVGDGVTSKGRAKTDISLLKIYSAQQLLRWNKDFGNHSLEILAGHESFSHNQQFQYARKTNEILEGVDNLTNFTNITSLEGFGSTYRTEGYLSRIKYDYNNKYFIESSFRRDGSSKFHKDNRWGNFWSAGASWIVSNESFFDSKFFDLLKFRVSYGEVGNDSAASIYAAQSLFMNDRNGGEAAIYQSQIGNKDLKWETSSSFNIAVDGRLFNRLSYTVEYFDKQSQNLLFNLNMPLSVGATSPKDSRSRINQNIGSISNRGIEVTLNYDVVKTQDWKWSVGGNATWLKNKILSLPEENRENGIVSSPFKRVEGRGIYDFWILQYVGVDKLNGDALYEIDFDNYAVKGLENGGKDVIADKYVTKIGENYYTTRSTYGKRDWSGSAIPKVEGSINTTLGYKNFTLSGLVTYALGGKVYDSAYKSLMAVSEKPTAVHKDVLGAWNGTPEGITEDSIDRIDPNGIPVVDFGRNSATNSTSTRFLKDGSYWVIKNVSLNYDFPKDYVKRLSLNSLSMNLGVENLYSFSKLQGMNPQQSFSGVNSNAFLTPRTVLFGINVVF